MMPLTYYIGSKPGAGKDLLAAIMEVQLVIKRHYSKAIRSPKEKRALRAAYHYANNIERLALVLSGKRKKHRGFYQEYE